MKKIAGIIAAPIMVAILLFMALSSCSGPFIDPGASGITDGGGGGGSSHSSGSHSSGGGNSAGTLTFTDGLPSSGYFGFSGDVFIIDNKTNTSASNWKKDAKIIAHYNSYFEGQETTYNSLLLSVPKRALTVANHSDISSDDKVWKGKGSYAIYVSSPEKILKDVTFKNGCAEVKWSDFKYP